MREAKTNGDCFSVSGRIIMEMADGDGSLVHAMVTRPDDGFRHQHAFVEIADGKLVLDQSNGADVMALKEDYFRAGHITESELDRYDPSDARFEMSRTGHFGPWDGEL